MGCQDGMFNVLGLLLMQGWLALWMGRSCLARKYGEDVYSTSGHTAVLWAVIMG